MKIKRVILTAVLMLAGMWAATQIAAHQLFYVPGLSGLLYDGGSWSLYAPWSIILWSLNSVVERPAVDHALGGFVLYALVVTGLMALWTRRAAVKVKPFGAEDWGTKRDMKKAGLLNEAGTIIGLYGGRLLTYNGPEHQLVSGASRSGKGVGHVVPTLFAWGGSALVYDVKNELWELTAGFRSKYQHCLFFNPTNRDSAHFNPLMEVRKGPNEVRDAQNLVEILINPDGSKKTLDVWDQNAFQFLTALVLHVLYAEPFEKKHLGRVRELLLDFNSTCDAMMRTPHRIHKDTQQPEPYPEIARVAGNLMNQSDRFRSSVRGTAEGYLTLWADEIVSEVTSRSDFSIGDLMCLDKAMTLYLQPPPSDADRVRPLIRLMLNQVARALMEHPQKDARGRAKKHRLLLLIDEFPTLGRLPFFSESLRQMAGYHIKAQLIVQSFNDIIEAYGPHNTIIDNCHVLCCFASADTTTQQRISAMTGEAVEYRESYSRPRSLLAGVFGDGGGRRNISQSEQVRPLLRPGEVRALPYDEQLIFVTGFKPFRTKKLRYYEYPLLRKRVLNPPDPKKAIESLKAAAAASRVSRDGAFGGEDDWRDEQAKGDLLPPSKNTDSPLDETKETPSPSRSLKSRTTDRDLEPEQGEFL